MASESRAEQIAAALQSQLGSIVGDSGVTYWYTVNRCVRAATLEAGCLDESLAPEATVYVVSPDTRETIRHTIGGSGTGHRRCILNVDLALCRRYKGTEDPYSTETPKRWTVQERLLRDALTKIESDETLGTSGLGVLAVDTPTASMAADETWVDGWAVVFQRLAILYDYTAAAP